MSQHKLKGLQVRINKANADLEIACEQAAIAEQEKSELLQLRRSLEYQIKQIQDSNKEVTMSEHAMLRYIERILGFDLSEITDRVITPEFKKAVQSMGDGKYPMSNKGRAVVRNNVIVTVED